MKKVIAIIGLAALMYAGCSSPVENTIEPVLPNFASSNGIVEQEACYKFNMPS